MPLTKSTYLAGLQCEKKLWLLSNDSDGGAEMSLGRQRTIDNGQIVGEAARECFPGGYLVSAPHTDPELALSQTEAAIAAGNTVLFEAAFCHREIFVRVDILRSSTSDDGVVGWDIIEVKSTSRVKDEHLPDLALQRYVLEGAGIAVKACFLMHINSGCLWPDRESLFETEDLTERLAPVLAAVEENASQLQEVAGASRAPDSPIGNHCRRPHDCQFKDSCWSHVPVPSVFTLRMPPQDRDELLEGGILDLGDIPTEMPLAPPLRSQVEMYLTGRPEIDWPAVADMLGELEYPIYFLDFETDNPPIPRFDNVHPYEQVPFQYSLHILDAEGELRHREYLHTDSSDPRSKLAQALVSDLGTEGSIVAYYATFEIRVIQGLAERFTDLELDLMALIGRFWDLLEVFKRHYRHPAFLGSNSLKSVLPVLVPSMSYSDLDVPDGIAAQVTWERLVDSRDDEDRRRLTEGLLVYCRQDTLAMVEIYRDLSLEVARIRTNGSSAWANS